MNVGPELLVGTTSLQIRVMLTLASGMLMFEEKQKKLPEKALEIVIGFAETWIGILGARRIVASNINAIERFKYVLLEFGSLFFLINRLVYLETMHGRGCEFESRSVHHFFVCYHIKPIYRS